MTPLRVSATLSGPLSGEPMLDALLGFVLARRMGLVAGFGPTQRLPVPIARDPSDRFYLCSGPQSVREVHERRYVHRRFPVAEAQIFGEPRLRRIDIGAGACRGYRIPHELHFVDGDRVTWYAHGDAEAIRDLLSEVTHLGRKRSAGRGPVRDWHVEPWEPWDGFPVLRDGKPLRQLPTDTIGLVEPAFAFRVLDPPYYEHVREELCAVPG